ncbi:lipopolysaccharide transport periplasmic protein LptA [Orbaceae bacterium ac157xtp]
MSINSPILFKKTKLLLASLILGIAPILAFAQTTPETTINNKPIAIDANNQQIDLQNNTITFTGNVVIEQDNLKMKADTVIIKNMQTKQEQIITAYGKPVYFEQIIINKDGQQLITGQSEQLIYSVKQNTVKLIGNAQLKQNDNQITSDTITYDINKQNIQSKSSKGNRVKTTIIPNQVKR